MSLLPGMMPGAAALKFRPSSLSFIASAKTAGYQLTLTAMANINPGDLLLMFDRSALIQTGGTPPLIHAVPSGFTLIADASPAATDADFMASYKIAVGNEDSTVLGGLAFPDAGSQKILLQFRGNGPVNSVIAGSIDTQITAGNPSAQVCAVTGGSAPLVVIGLFGTSNSSGNGIGGVTFTPAEDAHVGILQGGQDGWRAAYKIYNQGATLADHTVDMDDRDNNNCLGSFYVEVH